MLLRHAHESGLTDNGYSAPSVRVKDAALFNGQLSCITSFEPNN
jgi:hypothetical protein